VPLVEAPHPLAGIAPWRRIAGPLVETPAAPAERRPPARDAGPLSGDGGRSVGWSTQRPRPLYDSVMAWYTSARSFPWSSSPGAGITWVM